MGNLFEWKKNLEKLDRGSVIAITTKAIRESENILKSLNQQQLSEGKNSFDILLGVYSRASELRYLFSEPKPIRPKEEGQPYNFEDTGDFFKSFVIRYSGADVSIFSTDDKTPLLISKYDDLFGLNELNFTNYIRNAIYPYLMRETRVVLSLN